MLLLTSVWSNVCAGLYDNQSRAVVSSTELTLCTPGTFLLGNYEFAFPKADSTTHLQLEYFDMLNCYAQQANLTLLPSSIIAEPIRDTICAGESYEWNGNTYTKPGSYTDTLSNIHGCDSIVTLHLHVLPDPPLTFTVNGVSFKMRRVRAGTFMMGATADDTEAEADEFPRHQVTLTRDYFMAETELTQALWTAVMGTTIEDEEAKGAGKQGLGYGPNYPMYCISYNDCLLFVERLNQLTGLTFRMPTEAEWEYAARGGHLSRGYKYPGSNDPLEVAWSFSKDSSKKLHEVKQLLPNELGLYDMAGNTWEWVYDYNRQYIEQSQTDPIGDTSSTNAFVRGGSSYYSSSYNRVSCRGKQYNKSFKANRITFRLVLDADRVIGEDNTTHQAYDTICAGETYEWNGEKYTESGIYTKTLQNIYGCDSIVTLHLEVNPTYEVHDTIVSCDSYTWHEDKYEVSGVYYDSLQSINGCDSVFVLHLTINKTIYAEETVTVCDSYTWNGKTYTESGNYTYTTTAANGCDSITTLHLTINMTVYAEETVTTCDSYTWNGQTYTENGNYTYTTTAANDCDSITTLHLTINKTVYAEETITACDSYTWNGETYTTSGDYPYTTTAANGCDSITTLHLTINKTIYAEETVTACDSYTWNGQTYTESGNYTYTTTAANDCDSITTLHLIINCSDTAFFTATACESYKWHGDVFTESGTYYYHTQTMLGCDSLEIMRLTILPPTKYLSFDTLLCHGATCEWRNMQFTTEGTYNDTVKNQLDCDSLIYILNLEYLPDVVFVEEDTLLCYGATCEWRDMQLTTAGTYNDTVKNQLNCDSLIYILHLEYLPDVVYVEEDTLLCYGATCEWRDLQLTTAGTCNDTIKNQLDCDSVIYILNLEYLPDVVFIEEDTLLCYGATCEWRGLQLTTAGSYNDTIKNQLDCDSVIYILNLEYLPDVVYVEEDTLLCHGITCNWRGLEFESAGTYNDTVKNQLNCDSVIYILNLKYLPDVEYIEEDTLLCYGATCEWRGLQLTIESTYNDTVKNQLDCDSLIYILHLEYLPDVEYITEDTLLCHGITCDWRGLQLTTKGTYNDTVKNQLNCDSVIYILNLEYLPDVEYIEEDTLLCHGATCEWRNMQFTTTGNYNDTVKNQLDCDSVIYILNLEYLPDVVFVEEDTLLCYGVTCNWRGLEFESAGTYNDTVKNQLDCDSIIYILNLEYLPDVVYIEEDTLLCHGATCDWRGLQLTTKGTYNDTVKNQLDCDSVIYILHLEYLPDVEYITEDTLLCHGVTCNWRGLEFESAGTYNDTVKNQLDCDSVIYILNLEYLPDVVFVEEDTLLCYGATCEWRNMQLTTADTYNDTVKNQLDCDSLIYILNLEYLPDVELFATDTFLCYGEACDWRGATYHESGIYHDTIRNILSCDSLIYTLNLVIYPEIPITHVIDTIAGAEYHWNDQIYTHGGDYTVTLPAITGCDSVVILHLMDNHAAIDTVIVYEQCAGSGQQEVEILTQGYIEQIVLNHSPQAQAAGLRDTVMMLSSTDDIYTIYYDDVRAGVHEVTAIGLFHGVEVASYPFTLTYLYPNTIFEQRYNDLIAVLTHDYNGGYDFSAFQWYKDGVLLPGETHSYLNQPLSFESEYSVLLTNTDGLQLMSCPIIAENKAELSVYPTILKHGEIVKCHMTDENMLFIHNSTGKILQEQPLKAGTTEITLPAISGVYLFLFVSNDHTERTFKVIVQ